LHPQYRTKYRELYETHWWWRAREEIICGEIRQRLPENSRVNILDIGCGDGLFFDRLRQFGDVEGVEPGANIVDPNGANRSRITVTPFDLNFKPGKQYGLILMLDVLEHLDAPADALSHAVSLLTPEGIIVATVPAFRILWTNHDRLNDHRTRFTRSSFGGLAGSAGMQILAMRYFFVWLFAAKLGTRAAEVVMPGEPRVPRIPPPALNVFLYWLSCVDDRMTRHLHVPVGSSLLAIGRRARKLQPLGGAPA
jgi:SAM-dependent methyltransferase